MLKLIRCLSAVVLSALAVPAAFAQGPPQPGPEHQKFKELEGTWDAIMKIGDGESKGTMVWKLELGGLWLASEFEGDFAGQKFTGKGLETYDPMKKKYVSVWADSMSTSIMLSEGTYDKEGKVLTMTGEGPGSDGSPAKYRMTTEHKDKDTIVWTMFGAGPDGKEAAMFSIHYNRRKK